MCLSAPLYEEFLTLQVNSGSLQTSTTGVAVLLSDSSEQPIFVCLS